jgi:hypothetical protein
MKLDRITRFILIGLEVFLGIGAVAGAVWVVPTLPPEWLAGTPFPDYAVPALALGVVIGGGAFLAATMLLFHEPWGVLLSLAVGLALAIFEVVETSVIGLDIWLQALRLQQVAAKGLPGTDLAGVPLLLGIPVPLWQQPLYFALGVVIFALALRLWTHQVRDALPTRPVAHA